MKFTAAQCAHTRHANVGSSTHDKNNTMPVSASVREEDCSDRREHGGSGARAAGKEWGGTAHRRHNTRLVDDEVSARSSERLSMWVEGLKDDRRALPLPAEQTHEQKRAKKEAENQRDEPEETEKAKKALLGGAVAASGRLRKGRAALQ